MATRPSSFVAPRPNSVYDAAGGAVPTEDASSGARLMTIERLLAGRPNAVSRTCVVIGERTAPPAAVAEGVAAAEPSPGDFRGLGCVCVCGYVGK